MIDFHTYPILIKELAENNLDYQKAAREIFFIGNTFQPLEVFHLEMDLEGVEKAVLLPIACKRVRGVDIVTNEQIAELCNLSSRFIGFCSVDPLHPGASKELEESIRSLGLKGLFLNPEIQGFAAEEPAIMPVLDKSLELKIPVMIHTGMTWAPNTTLAPNHPIKWEPIIQKYPDLNIVLSKFGWPWVWEAVALALKYPNVYLDLSAHFYDSPIEFFQMTYSQQIPITLIDRSLNSKILFGSNYPRVEIKNMVRAFNRLPLSSSSREKIGYRNAERLLGMENSK
jgi:uncharacterized protein